MARVALVLGAERRPLSPASTAATGLAITSSPSGYSLSKYRLAAVSVDEIGTPPFCTAIGPVSTPASGWNTVTPDSVAPSRICHASALPPRKRGSSDGWKQSERCGGADDDLGRQDHGDESEHVELGAELAVLLDELGDRGALAPEARVAVERHAALLGLGRERSRAARPRAARTRRPPRVPPRADARVCRARTGPGRRARCAATWREASPSPSAALAARRGCVALTRRERRNEKSVRRCAPATHRSSSARPGPR